MRHLMDTRIVTLALRPVCQYASVVYVHFPGECFYNKVRTGSSLQVSASGANTHAAQCCPHNEPSSPHITATIRHPSTHTKHAHHLKTECVPHLHIVAQ